MKRVLVSIILIFMFLLMGAIVIFLWKSATGEIINSIDVYFVEKSLNTLGIEKKELVSRSKEDKVVEALTYIENGPISTNLSKSFYSDSGAVERIISEYEIDGENVEITLNENYEILTNPSKIFVKSSIVLTLTKIEGIKNILFIYNGEYIPFDMYGIGEGKMEEVYTFTKENVYANPKISPINFQRYTVELYFKGIEGLVRENRVIYVDPSITKEQYIVQELINGSNEDHSNLVPSTTKVYGVTVDNNTAFVNLSSEFVNNSGSNLEDQVLSVYSIVNSLTALKGINSVQILINSQRYPGYGGDLDLLNGVLSRGDAYIENYVEQE
ncbi:MAG: GerMN domain-containing protein [Lachnospirales bacterium]